MITDPELGRRHTDGALRRTCECATAHAQFDGAVVNSPICVGSVYSGGVVEVRTVRGITTAAPRNLISFSSPCIIDIEAVITSMCNDQELTAMCMQLVTDTDTDILEA